MQILQLSLITGAVSSCISDGIRRLCGDKKAKGGALLNTAEIEEKENDIRLDNVFLKYDRPWSCYLLCDNFLDCNAFVLTISPR